MRTRTSRLTTAVLLAALVPCVVAPAASATEDEVGREAAAQATDGTARLLFRTSGTDWLPIEVPVEDAVPVARDLAAQGEVEVDVARQHFAADPHYATYGWEQPMTHTDRVWPDGIDGTGVTVAVLDTGVFPGHVEYRDRLTNGYDAVRRRELAVGATTDDHGHGTLVSGTLGAARRNGHGSAGTAPGVTIMPVDVFDGPYAHDSAIADGIRWAVDNGADVVNMSLGGPGVTSALTEAVDHARRNGVVVVASAGNFDREHPEREAAVNYPANDPDVIGVANSNRADAWSGDSQSGPMVEITAPGTRLLSTGTAGGYKLWSGTSASAPVLSGVVALMIDAAGLEGRMTAQHAAMLRASLHETAVDLGASGFDSRTGHGRVDADDAVAAFLDRVTPPTPEPVESRDDETDDETGTGSDDEPAPSPKDDDPALDGVSRDRVTPARGAVDQRATGRDGRAAATEVATQRFFDGHRARRVLLCRDGGDSHFADCLAASAGVDDRTALLFTAGGRDATLSGDTRDAIREVLPNGGEVVILGGTAAVSSAAEGALDRAGYRTTRLSGKDRFVTAVEVARELQPDDTHVLLARGDVWADAIAGGSVASARGLPLLLTRRDSIPAEVVAELRRRGGDDVRVTVLGGAAAVSEDVVSELRGLVGRVDRVSGRDRVATSIEIARRLHGVTGPGDGDQWVFARGHRDWQHALAATMVSAVNDAPMLLVGGTIETPAAVRDYLGTVGGRGGSLVGPDIASHRATLARYLR